ncbi:hypothetical protein BJX63DRAFT_416796 [Aspergillus granulosus]|uniref:Uncharacterized protein n=1 Tax=Aspergillus granulosus TaxID=176169 RepID=A0ABR4GRH7_9EURO
MGWFINYQTEPFFLAVRFQTNRPKNPPQWGTEPTKTNPVHHYSHITHLITRYCNPTAVILGACSALFVIGSFHRAIHLRDLVWVVSSKVRTVVIAPA